MEYLLIFERKLFIVRADTPPLHQAVIRYDTIEPGGELRAAIEAVKFIIDIYEGIL